jgi:glycyl-tRNA synthetase beta chain
MKHRDLLFEIGCEDLPPMQIPGALDALRDAFTKAAAEARIDHGAVKTYATPRRLALYVEEVALAQRPEEQVKVGPAMAAAFDADGKPSGALLGFLRANGASASDVFQVEQTRRNQALQYAAVRVRSEVVDTRDLLPDFLSELPGRIHWPKPMRWGDGQTAFARPIHWLVALFGSESLPVRFGGARSEPWTRGHRFHFPGTIDLGRADEYVQLLREHNVIVDIRQRRHAIDHLARAAAQELGGNLVEDDELLEEILYLVEWPVAIYGSFDPAFLALPPEVLRTSMRKHQRFFAVVDGEGKLMPHFITIANTSVRDPGVVAHGNKRVLHARLKDAEFFFREDQRRPLSAYLDTLKRVTYVEELGSMWDRAQRIEQVAEWLCGALALDPETTAQTKRAALLCKADLATQMVGEFPELQGLMGGEYAKAQGEPLAVSRAIAEHYMPRGASDQPAESKVGALVSIADRAEAMVGLFALGKAPTGAADRYGLRRAALGLVRAVLTHGLRVHLPALIEAAVATLPASVVKDKAALAAQVHEFILTRLRNHLTHEHPAEVVDAVLALGARLEDLPAALARVEVLSETYNEPDFEPIAVTFKRAANILTDPPVSQPVNPALFESPAEVLLYDTIQTTGKGINAALARRDFPMALELLVSLRDPVDTFFDAVLVNDPEEGRRANRHAMLRDIVAMVGQLADVRRL